MEPLKNIFSPELVQAIALHLARQMRSFDPEGFVNPILTALPALELKQRAQLIADRLHQVLPDDRVERGNILVATLHPDEFESAGNASDEAGLCGWAVMPLTMVVGQYGLETLQRELEALKQMTKRFTSEFAIRYCLLRDQAGTMEAIGKWVADPNRHVRRLVSEGTRPRLPWAMQLPSLIVDPTPALSLLKRLRDDPDSYVRRSVANHLNDISKDHPERLAGVVEDWMRDASEERRALLRHASRSLIKKGHPRVLAAFGRHPARLALGPLELSGRSVPMPGMLGFAMRLTSTAEEAQNLTVDYVIHFRKANGGLVAKVFKGASFTLAPGESRYLRRGHRFAEITTRKHYAGLHRICLRINGADTEAEDFELSF